jgi:hypothetical protein
MGLTWQCKQARYICTTPAATCPSMKQCRCEQLSHITVPVVVFSHKQVSSKRELYSVANAVQDHINSGFVEYIYWQVDFGNRTTRCAFGGNSTVDACPVHAD